MAASIDDRHQPENSQLEQQARRVQLRRRQQRTLQKELFEQEVPRIPIQAPKLRLGRSNRGKNPSALGTRPNPEPPKPLFPRQRITKSAWPNHPSVQPRRPISEITPQRTAQSRPSARRVEERRPIPEITPQRTATTAQGSMLPQNSAPRGYTTQESGYTREEQASGTMSRMNPWQVQPKSPSVRPLSSTPGSQTPKSLDTNQEGKGQGVETSRIQRLNPLAPSSRRRQNNNPPRTTTKIASPAQQGKTIGKRVSVKAGSQPSPSPTRPKAKRPPKRPLHPLVYIIRLLILGVGIGAIAGTLLSALNPASHASIKKNETPQGQVQESPKHLSQATPLALNQEILPLKSNIQALVANNSKLQPGVFIVDLDTGGYIDINSNSTLSAASTIKLPILVALFQDVDAGKIRLDETLTLQPEMIATGSGDLQYKKPGTKFTVLELATKMIAISDNTATNMLIARLGGVQALTQRFHSWGLSATVLRNALPDLEGMNVTTPKELATLMAIVNQGQLVSLQSRDRILDIMQNNQINNLLPQGLGNGAIIAHKTGNIGALLADVGLVNMPSGKSYIISVMVQRPFNDPSAQELIRKISQTTYGYFNQPAVSPSTSSMPSDSTARESGAIALDNYQR